MLSYKKELSDRLSQAVSAIYGSELLICYGENESGFFCDYDIPPLNPHSFELICEKLNTEGVKAAVKPDRFSGAYEDGDASGRMLQRIYILAFETKEEMSAYEKHREQAKGRDHKVIGAEQHLFSSSEEIGQGLTLWHPKGAMLRYLLESFGQTAHILNGYQWVYTPHIGRAKLWETSGHLGFYKDSMYNPISIDDEEYYLKPMNCPFHINIYNSEVRSYRELPIRYAEYGTVYRYELSGTLGGLTRVRGFTQDDAHIICTPEQVREEVESALKFSLYILRSFGLTQFEPYISTKPQQKSIGSKADWDMATDVLKDAVTAAGLAFEIDEGGGAFYGPKIDLKLRDSLGRQWQCSTIQFDFNLPSRFSMRYIGSDGERHEPFMIHRALFGSIERFTALLIEHYGGDFPFWFAPMQIGVVPVREEHCDYAKKTVQALTARGYRAKADMSSDNMRSKIKSFWNEKLPFILVVGDRERDSGSFSVRSREDGELGTMDMEALIKHLDPLMAQGRPQSIM